MAVNARIAPFINDEFVITSKWWNERINPVTGEVEIHRGLDISTYGVSKPVYSMLNGIVHSLGTSSSRGNWIIIKDNDPSSSTYGYATLYMHLASLPNFFQGQSISVGDYVAPEGTTGISTGIHLHVEMQDLNRWGNVWHSSYVQSDYIDPTVFMGIPNVEGTQVIYNGTPGPIPPTPSDKKRHHFPWYIISKKNRQKRVLNI